MENTLLVREHCGSGRGFRQVGTPSGTSELKHTFKRVLCAGLEVATWLILPVVIRSSQRLSHARLSKSNFTVKLRMAHYISYSLLDSTLLLGYP